MGRSEQRLFERNGEKLSSDVNREQWFQEEWQLRIFQLPSSLKSLNLNTITNIFKFLLFLTICYLISEKETYGRKNASLKSRAENESFCRIDM